jgi:hypothetical protein
LLARTFFQRSPAQARLEYRLAYMQDAPNLAYAVAKESVGLVHDYDEAMELAPPGPAGVQLLSSIADSLEGTLPATQIRLDEEILRRDPTAEGPLTRAVNASLLDLRDRAPWCESRRKECVKEALALAASLRARRQTACKSWELHARVLVLAGDEKHALDEIDESINIVDDRITCARLAVQLATELNNSARAELSIERLTKMGCASQQECVDIMSFAASSEVARRNPLRAVLFYKRALAAAADPDDPDLLVAIASTSEANQMHGDALEAYGRLARRQPNNAEWPRKVSEQTNALKSRMMEGAQEGLGPAKP